MRAATSQGVAIARSGSGNGALERLGTGNEMRVRDWRSPGAPSARVGEKEAREGVAFAELRGMRVV